MNSSEKKNIIGLDRKMNAKSGANKRILNKKKKRSKSVFFIAFILSFLISASITESVLNSSGEHEIRIKIVYSSEKAKFMSIAYTQFLDYWNERNPDEKIMLEMHPYGSSDSVISILNGEIHPVIWSPASSIWIPFLNTKWENAGYDYKIALLNESTRVIYSPIVIATWEKFNQTYNIKGIDDVRKLVLDPNVDVKMAHTDPRLSNSGFMATIMAISTFSGIPSENLTINDLLNETTQQRLKEFESSAVMYGKSTGFLSRYMKNSGPDALNIAILYENLITDISESSNGGKVIAVYPEEGTLYSDHPFCILNAPWVSADQKRVAEEFISFLNRPETLQSAIQTGFRPINRSIPLDPGIFNYATSGIQEDISHIPEMKTPDGEVLLKIPYLWQLCKNTV